MTGNDNRQATAQTKLVALPGGRDTNPDAVPDPPELFVKLLSTPDAMDVSLHHTYKGAERRLMRRIAEWGVYDKFVQGDPALHCAISPVAIED